MNKKDVLATQVYQGFIEELKARVNSARNMAARVINREIVLLYWDIGQSIVEKQKVLGWGDSVVEMVASDLQKEFPGIKGFSPQNVWRMLQFYQTHTRQDFLSQVVKEMVKSGKKERVDKRKLSQVVRGIVSSVPWGHHVNVLPRISDAAERLYYLRTTARLGWSRNLLLNQIKAGNYERSIKEKKVHNFSIYLQSKLPESLKGKLPTAKQLATVIKKALGKGDK